MTALTSNELPFSPFFSEIRPGSILGNNSEIPAGGRGSRYQVPCEGAGNSYGVCAGKWRKQRGVIDSVVEESEPPAKQVA